ncbi:dUTP diphosphatase [Colwellia sp. PAMC 20917]|jgi:dimeric dUTPase (all-alpha-NTP-PPase superfamily)|uniref:dUTP diphosphatase n=1 Tax=unclassified Colwellia TaxID=196834 RepID=UPI000878FA21|nr:MULTISPECIES: dUTP diphosphatase [unclassified Colwellia]AOW77559.1 dUTP diphosphatase [Colwellia sp. PAMC 20917]MBA6349618.1 dUTP diphosphatase [Colwellia sp. BRX8-9]MBA6380771.1 dUTP diphosphatase [Colwellia sp. BRX10-7]MBA6388302.1 dUTP diphosphatase [Colwellia sp. BRX10-2]MBA6403318.1 dUTP diphosphatase [Colwellia sp. BRX10-5]
MSANSAAQNQIKQMLTMQDAMNTRVSDTWQENGYEWYRAIWVECAEMLDHHGWKWWKHQEIDIAQVQLELVDIFHFGLSLRLMTGETVTSITDTLATELTESSGEKDFKIALENLASAAVTNKSFDAIALADCMRLMNMDLDELFRQYVGKNTLNFFRQDHGYKEGTYIKVWHGEEDNEVLANLVNTLDASASDFQQQLYAALEAKYPA